jgi:hypothetical protein
MLWGAGNARLVEGKTERVDVSRGVSITGVQELVGHVPCVPFVSVLALAQICSSTEVTYLDNSFYGYEKIRRLDICGKKRGEKSMGYVGEGMCQAIRKVCMTL